MGVLATPDDPLRFLEHQNAPPVEPFFQSHAAFLFVSFEPARPNESLRLD